MARRELNFLIWSLDGFYLGFAHMQGASTVLDALEMQQFNEYVLGCPSWIVPYRGEFD